MVMETILDVSGVSIQYGAIRVVKEVSLALNKGERHALLGTNGAGKTSLFNGISGEVPLSAGRISFRGEEISCLQTYQRARLGIGRTFQTSLLFGDRSVRENMRISVLGNSSPHVGIWSWGKMPQIERRVEGALHEFGLVEVSEQMVAEMSYGQQREIELCMALIGNPDLLLLDEPAAGMSPQARKELVRRVEALPRNTTILFVEHDMDVALRLADRVTVMRDGEVVATGTPDEICANPTVREIYLGKSH